MPKTVRIATFNCENLFSRPKIFSARGDRPSKLLGLVDQLQKELSKSTFNKTKIKSLKKQLSGYAKVNDIRGKHTKVKGAKEWVGWVELVRSSASLTAVKNIARVINDTNADVIGLVEVENRPLLQEFHDKFLKKKGRYKYIRLIDGNDNRGIDVAVISRLPINWIRSHIHETTKYMGKTVKLFSRDCLEVDVQVTKQANMRVLVNHLKSMGYSPKKDPRSIKRRTGQAKGIVKILSSLDLKKDYAVVMGDLNSPPDDPKNTSLKPLLKNPGLYNVNLELPKKERGTYRTGTKQLDYILVSSKLRKKLKSVKIERRGMFGKKSWPRYNTVTSRKTEASDHAAIIVRFTI